MSASSDCGLPRYSLTRSGRFGGPNCRMVNHASIKRNGKTMIRKVRKCG